MMINKIDTSPLSHCLVGGPLICYLIQVESAGRKKPEVGRESVTGVPPLVQGVRKGFSEDLWAFLKKMCKTAHRVIKETRDIVIQLSKHSK